MLTPFLSTWKCVRMCVLVCQWKNSIEGRLPINTCFVPVNISRHGEEMMASVKEERKRKGTEGGRQSSGGGGVTSIPLRLWKRRPHVGWTHSFIHSARLFSAQWVYGYWKGVAVALLSQKESIFLPLLRVSVSASFSLIQYFLQNTTLPSPCTGRECWKAF